MNGGVPTAAPGAAMTHNATIINPARRPRALHVEQYASCAASASGPMCHVAAAKRPAIEAIKRNAAARSMLVFDISRKNRVTVSLAN